MNSSRRRFIQTAVAASGLAALTGGLTPPRSFAAQATGNAQATENKVKFRLGVASYTFRNFDRARTLQMTRRAGLPAICFKDMHLAMNSTDEQCAAAATEAKQAGLDLYSCGVVYMNTPEEVTNAFRYAKAAGMTTIVAAPRPNLLTLVDEKVKETGIYIAIHNHGPGDGTYPTPEAVMEKVGSLDKRIGICNDVGHTARIGGDNVKSFHDFKDRIFDVHFKDVTAATPQGRECICGRGVLDIPAYLQALIDIGYDRVVSFEHESDANDPLPGLAECVGYVNGVLRVLGTSHSGRV
ncbi:MAG: TIM barrel protein [Planctomycetaceae bacterium]|nr:TIM barrel protein [Planctomycetaceae bacterium]